MKLKQLTYFLSALFFIYGCNSENTLNVATSANMQFAMEEIVEIFEKENNIKVELIISSSGKLTSQIEQGAPYDVFVAANTKYPLYLDSSGLTKSSPEVYAKGKLVIWTMKDFTPSFDVLTAEKVEKIAIANPKTAPYGNASIEALKQHGIYELVKEKLIYAESISQVNQFVSTQSADIGFTALSVVSAPKMKDKGRWTSVDQKDHLDILQAATIIANTENKEQAEAFYNFLFSEKAQIILNNYGYLRPDNE